MSHAATSTTEVTSTGIPTGRVAIWWFLASEIAIFGGLIACYVLYRVHHPAWNEEAHHTATAIGAVNTVVLLTSSLSAVLAEAASHRGDYRRASSLLGFTVLGGLAFLGIKAFEYSREIAHGFVPARSLFWSFYYLMTGLHALHVVAGMIALGAVSVAVRRGEHPARVEYVAIYWHFVDVVWIFLFPLLYLAS